MQLTVRRPTKAPTARSILVAPNCPRSPCSVLYLPMIDSKTSLLPGNRDDGGTRETCSSVNFKSSPQSRSANEPASTAGIQIPARRTWFVKPLKHLHAPGHQTIHVHVTRLATLLPRPCHAESRGSQASTKGLPRSAPENSDGSERACPNLPVRGKRQNLLLTGRYRTRQF